MIFGITVLHPNSSLQELESWLDDVIIGLDLCPWARPVRERQQIKLLISQGASPKAMAEVFAHEMHSFLSPISHATVLIGFPRWVIPFPIYWDLVCHLEDNLAAGKLAEHAQLVAFHPGFLFQGTPQESLAHWVNRAPFPVLQLLRPEDVARALEGDREKARALSARNEKKISRLTEQQRHQLFPWLFSDAN